MVGNVKRLAYFHWVAPVDERVLASRGGLEIVRLDFAGDERKNMSELARVHGYQSPSKTNKGDGHWRPGIKEYWLPGAELVARCPNLLAVCAGGAGYNVVDVDACTRAGVIVCNQSGAGREGVAEQALAFMLSLSKKIALVDRMLRRGDSVNRWAMQSNDMFGKTVGIVGLGQIGERLAQMCSGLFDMTVLAYDKYFTAEQIAARGAVKVELDELLRRSDFVSLNCPLTKETTGLMGREQFALMKPTAFFITTARGQVHDEDALVDALKTRRIAGAGIDVFHVEPPPPDHPLLAFDNVIATPHMGGITVESLKGIADATVEQWINIFEGAVPPRLINPEVWPLYCDRFEKLLGFRPRDIGGQL